MRLSFIFQVSLPTSLVLSFGKKEKRDREMLVGKLVTYVLSFVFIVLLSLNSYVFCRHRLLIATQFGNAQSVYIVKSSQLGSRKCISVEKGCFLV